MADFGHVINALLTERGMTQTDLARESGLSTSYIAQLVTGLIKNPTLTKAFAIADALGVSLQEIRDRMENGAPAE